MPLLPIGPADRAPASRAGAAGRRSSPGHQLAAAGAAVVVIAEIVVAPVTIGSTVVMIGISRLGRGSSAWLALPAATGLAWAGFEGPRLAAGGFAAAGVHVVALIAGPGTVPTRLARLPEAIGQWRAALAGQLPLALTAAAVQASVVGEVRSRLGPRRLAARADMVCRASNGRTDQDSAYRAGPVSAVRRAYLTATLRRGEVATVDGACLGIARDTGRRAALTWAEAASGVLITGLDPGSVTRTGLDLAAAAIQHRKSVIIADLSGQPGQLAAAVAGACSATHAPLRIWSWADEVAAGGAVGVAEVLAWRQVLLAHGGSPLPEAAAELARSVAAALTAALAERRALGVPADCLAWFDACERADDELLSELVACTRNSELPFVLTTTSGPAAARLAGQAGVVVVRGPSPRGWPRRGVPGVLPELLAGRRDDDLALLIRGPRPRLVTGSQAVR